MGNQFATEKQQWERDRLVGLYNQAVKNLSEKQGLLVAQATLEGKVQGLEEQKNILIKQNASLEKHLDSLSQTLAHLSEEFSHLRVLAATPPAPITNDDTKPLKRPYALWKSAKTLNDMESTNSEIHVAKNQGEAQRFFDAALKLEDSYPGVAKVYYEMSMRRAATEQFRCEVQKRLDVLRQNGT